MKVNSKSIQKMKAKHILSIVFLLFSFTLFSQYTFSFTGPSGSMLTDHGVRVLSKIVDIPESVNKLSVSVDIEHTWINDLEMTIINPEGERFIVFSRLGSEECFGCDGDDLSLLFHDASNIAYFDLSQQCSDKPAYSGESNAMVSLDSILSTNFNGEWTIEVRDYWPHESGKINSIVLTFSNYEEPLCTELTAPIEGQEMVAVNTLIEWNVAEYATGYFLSLGTESGSNNILDKIDVGNQLSYDPGILDCDQDYYVSLIPYNPFGEALDCVEQLFHTEFVVASSNSSNLTICQGESVQLEANGGTDYSWYPEIFLDDPNSQNPIVTPLESIEYTLIVMNENGCADTLTLAISVPLIEIIVDSVYHVRTGFPGFIMISDNGPDGTYLYEWTGPNGFSSNTQDIDNLEIGCYTLIITDTITGCTAETIICVDDLTDVPVKNNPGDINIYPNPVSNFVSIDFGFKEKQEFEIQLYDISGKIVGVWYKNKDLRYYQIDLSSYSQGIYEMTCISGNFIHRARLFKAKK